MNIQRSNPSTGHVNALAQEMADLNGPCVGCEGCNGVCQALIDALMLPNVILSRKRDSQ
ncbi:MAG: hypothetical protein AB8B51_00700 [Sedimentitalea sp.]